MRRIYSIVMYNRASILRGAAVIGQIQGGACGVDSAGTIFAAIQKDTIHRRTTLTRQPQCFTLRMDLATFGTILTAIQKDTIGSRTASPVQARTLGIGCTQLRFATFQISAIR